VWLEQDAIGINYLDVTHRNGAVPLQLPSGLGLEGTGRVAAIGPGVTNVKVGDRVSYLRTPTRIQRSCDFLRWMRPARKWWRPHSLTKFIG
jgi:NADPH:quinone reductase-like Zn-dependent oxidoreductase